jgi:hypothetical protein
MKTAWRAGGVTRRGWPVSLVVSAFAPVRDRDAHCPPSAG